MPRADPSVAGAARSAFSDRTGLNAGSGSLQPGFFSVRHVVLSLQDEEWDYTEFGRTTLTNGTYDVPGLPAGAYRVQFDALLGARTDRIRNDTVKATKVASKPSAPPLSGKTTFARAVAR